MLDVSLAERNTLSQQSVTKARDIKVARYLLYKQYPVQQVLEATGLDPQELSLVIKEVRQAEGELESTSVN